jgi:hypothetical protein
MIDSSTGGSSSAGGRVVVVEVVAVDAVVDRVGWVVVDEFAAGVTICVGAVVAGEAAFGDEVVDVVVDVVLVVDVDVVVEVELVVVVAEPTPRSSDALSTIGPRFPSVISPATPRMLIMMLLMLDHDAHVDCSETLTVVNDVDVSDAVGPCWYIFPTQSLLP